LYAVPEAKAHVEVYFEDETFWLSQKKMAELFGVEVPTVNYHLDDERLKQGKKFGKDYFEELLERIREIRASERRFYQKITDIYAQCSSDYDPKSTITQIPSEN